MMVSCICVYMCYSFEYIDSLSTYQEDLMERFSIRQEDLAEILSIQQEVSIERFSIKISFCYSKWNEWVII